MLQQLLAVVSRAAAVAVSGVGGAAGRGGRDVGVMHGNSKGISRGRQLTREQLYLQQQLQLWRPSGALSPADRRLLLLLPLLHRPPHPTQLPGARQGQGQPAVAAAGGASGRASDDRGGGQACRT